MQAGFLAAVLVVCLVSESLAQSKKETSQFTQNEKRAIVTCFHEQAARFKAPGSRLDIGGVLRVCEAQTKLPLVQIASSGFTNVTAAAPQAGGAAPNESGNGERKPSSTAKVEFLRQEVAALEQQFADAPARNVEPQEDGKTPNITILRVRPN